MNTQDSNHYIDPDLPESQSPEEGPYRIGEMLYLPESARLPLDHCVCCGRPAIKSVRKAVRNPRDPRTWFTRQPVVDIGLCKKHTEENSIAIALTYSLVGLGVILLLTGAIALHLPTLITGGLAASISGVFRARKPVWGTLSGPEQVCLRGIANPYLVQIPERNTEL